MKGDGRRETRCAKGQIYNVRIWLGTVRGWMLQQHMDPSKCGVKEYGLGVPLAVTNIIK